MVGAGPFPGYRKVTETERVIMKEPPPNTLQAEPTIVGREFTRTVVTWEEDVEDGEGDEETPETPEVH